MTEEKRKILSPADKRACRKANKKGLADFRPMSKRVRNLLNDRNHIR